MTSTKRSLVYEYLFYHIFRNECIAAQLVEILTRERIEILPVRYLSSEDYQGRLSDGQYLEGCGLSSDHRYDIKLFKKDSGKDGSEDFEIELGKIVRRIHSFEESNYDIVIRNYCEGKTQGHPRRPVTLIYLCDVDCTADKVQVLINDHPLYYTSRTDQDGTFRVITVNMKSRIINARIGDLTPFFDYMHTLDFAQVERTYQDNGMTKKLYQFLSDLNGCVCEFLASSYEKQNYLRAHRSERKFFEAGVNAVFDTFNYLIQNGQTEEIENLVFENPSIDRYQMVEDVSRKRVKNGEDISPIHKLAGPFFEEDDLEEEGLPEAEDAKNGEEILLDTF